MPHTPSGGGSMMPPVLPLPSVMMSMNAWRSNASAIARRSSGLLNGAGSGLISRLRPTLVGFISQIACGACSLICRSNGTVTPPKVMSSLPDTKVRIAVDMFLMIAILYPVKIRLPRFPVIRVFRQLDRFIRFVVDEFERAGPDRSLAHILGRYVARVDRRETGGKQRDKSRLRPLQYECHLVVAVGRHLVEVAVPGFTRVDAQLVTRAAEQQIPGAFDIGGGERFAVVPFDTLMQFEGQLAAALLVPCPTRRKIRHDRLHAVLLHLLVVHDQVVEHSHRRTHREDGGFLVDRHASGTVDRKRIELAA